ncbi:hypothetical protein AZE42_05347 [Rhizopogon vesiculosus]|uniref:RING-type domain-containing protein n=1 Tax=Rhizopogon vesiculosus TaxID=180088 RepID=A0A1J8QQL2_9AGAM|nr:hypothetical protein AZE42_05347 [Rhizopogon vesiculosus]
MHIARLLGIVYHQLALVLALVVQFVHHLPNVGHNVLAILSRTRVDRKGKQTRIKDDGKIGTPNKGLRYETLLFGGLTSLIFYASSWSILSNFVLKLMFTLTPLQVAYFDSEEEQRWLLQQHSIECGCCFDSYPLDKMIQCPEAHLFCKSCMSSYASNLLGEHNHNIACMDQSGCALLFPQSQLERFLTPTLLGLYHRVKQFKEVEAARLENLEECPFCDYKCIIEDKTEKLFRCENMACGVVSCQKCKNPDHSPKSCKKVPTDKELDIQHTVEEAMSRALMRNCPKCRQAFIKERGCNKMTCPNCRTLSCYSCRKVIDGYNHFGPVSDKSKCHLWDEIEKRHAEEVERAAKKVIKKLQRDSRIKIDMCDGKIHAKFRLLSPMVRILRFYRTAAA